MSLTSFIKLSDVKQRFIKEFPMPDVSLRGKMLAHPVTTHYSLIGTAFDYLMRFYLEKLNPSSVKRQWVAEEAVELTRKIPKLFKLTNKSLSVAKTYYSAYIKSGNMTSDTFRAAIFLAQLDPIFRAGYIDKNIGNVDDNDIKDLENIMKIVKPEMFKANQHCILNPTFGDASHLVGGADADFIIDNNLIDIKTTIKLELSREHFNQLVGYYILSKIGSIDGSQTSDISNFGIYYSRHGVLKSFPTKLIEEHPNLDKFIDWFSRKAKLTFGETRVDWQQFITQ